MTRERNINFNLHFEVLAGIFECTKKKKMLKILVILVLNV